ncbi:MAG: response regulator [SAR324 cluster bacterium]|nr:response regulator [SAR324 cluster bacterium]
MTERKNVTIMIVDDQPSVRDTVRIGLRVIRKFKFTFLEAADGYECLATLRSGAKPDLIVTDLMMPELNGMELIHRLKNNPETHFIPIIVISAKNSTIDVLEALKAGAIDYLTKPFTPQDLQRAERTIELSLQLNRHRDEISWQQSQYEIRQWKLTRSLEKERIFHLNKIQQILPLCHQLLAYYFPENKREIMCIGVYEIMMNGMVHGNFEVSSDLRDLEDGEEKFFDAIKERQETRPYSDRFMTVQILLNEQALTLKVLDQGKGFSLKEIPAMEDETAYFLMSHGRGITIARTAFDSVEFEFPPEGGTCVVMVKEWPPQTQDDSEDQPS